MCSSTSAAITRSKEPSPNGIAVASPRTGRARAAGGTSPDAAMAAVIALTWRSSP